MNDGATELPQYSVLMSVYSKDEPSYFDKAINSMICQTLSPSEIVVVCDGPLNEALECVLTKWRAAIPDCLKVVRIPENVGLGNALKIGIEQCSNRLIARMDSDDISRSDRCEKLIKELLNKELSVVGGAIAEFDKEPGDITSIRRMPTDWRDVKEFAKSRNPMNHVSVVFNKDDVLSVGGYKDFHYLEDYYLWVRMIIAGYRLGNIDDVVVDVRVGSGMYKRRSNWKYLKSQFAFFDYLNENDFITLSECLKSKTIRLCSTLVPSSIVKALYMNFLRTKE